MDGKIYIGDDSGNITVFKPGKDEEDPGVEQTARRSGKVEATPVAVNGVLYFMTETRASCGR